MSKSVKNLNIKINFGAEKSSWERAYYWAFIATVVIFIISSLLVFIKPISSEIKTVIDDEVKNTNIQFDQKTIDKIKKRLEIPPGEMPNIGKNPFSS